MFALDWFFKSYQQETDLCEVFSEQQHGIIGQYEFWSNKDLGLSSQFCVFDELINFFDLRIREENKIIQVRNLERYPIII